MKTFSPNMVDGYKLGHAAMYTEGTDFLYSNLTPRSDKYFKGSRLFDGRMVVFGMSGAIQEIVEDWNDSFFSQPKEKVIARYKRRVDGYLGAGVIDVSRMAALHDLGYLPLEIKTLDEGYRVKMKIPILTIKNTLPEFFWLVNYLETSLSDMIWKSATNATIAYEYKRIATDWAIKTGSPVETVLFQLHDFSMRGMSGYEDASRSGSGHLATGLLGTDTVGAIDYIEDYYGQDLPADYLIAASIPATEHAVSSSNILTRVAKIDKEINEQGIMVSVDFDSRLLAEQEFLLYYITKLNPSGFCSYVADTYGYWDVLSKILSNHIVKDAIMTREGRLVIRPDSGDPVDVICGIDVENLDEAGELEYARAWAEEALVDKVRSETDHGEHGDSDASGYFSFDGVFYEAKVDIEWNRHDKQYYYIDGHELVSFEEVEFTPEQKGSIQVLWEIFGGTVNEAGFKVLDSHIGLIYGDSITIDRADKILEKLAAKGFASQNVVFGVGSYTYQMNSRDTFGTAMKATATGVHGEFFEIYKDPATGDKLKKSAKGLLYVEKNEHGGFVLTDQVDSEKEKNGELKTRFKDGKFSNLDNIETIRNRLI